MNTSDIREDLFDTNAFSNMYMNPSNELIMFDTCGLMEGLSGEQRLNKSLFQFVLDDCSNGYISGIVMSELLGLARDDVVHDVLNVQDLDAKVMNCVDKRIPRGCSKHSDSHFQYSDGVCKSRNNYENIEMLYGFGSSLKNNIFACSDRDFEDHYKSVIKRSIVGSDNSEQGIFEYFTVAMMDSAREVVNLDKKNCYNIINDAYNIATALTAAHIALEKGTEKEIFFVSADGDVNLILEHMFNYQDCRKKKLEERHVCAREGSIDQALIESEILVINSLFDATDYVHSVYLKPTDRAHIKIKPHIKYYSK